MIRNQVILYSSVMAWPKNKEIKTVKISRSTFRSWICYNVIVLQNISTMLNLLEMRLQNIFFRFKIFGKN